MVEFITLFLGALVAGPTAVAFQVHQDVATLEVRLDHQAVATLRGRPWQLEVDLGEELAPHLLEAVAYAAEGREIGRARQWINLTPKQTEVTISLERNPADDRLVARLAWQSLSLDNQPVSARFLFDGRVVESADPKVLALPPHDPDRLHHLRVELEFSGGLQTSAEITFGGVYGDAVSSELTAFPVSVDGRRELPAIAEMQSWFRAGGRPLRVHAVETGLAEIVVVRAPSAEDHLLKMLRKRRSARPILRKEHRLRILGVAPARVDRGGGPFLVFPRSDEIRTRVGGLLESLVSVELPKPAAAEVRLADAVAVAGLFANQSARRRAVVLLATDEPHDASQFGIRQVRDYLERVGVPLIVWNPQVGEKESGHWGPALNVSTDSRLEQAYRELSRSLEQQRIVWLSGLYLPQAVAIADSGAPVQRVR